MKILYTSVFRDGTGYSQAAIGNVLAGLSAGLDIVCRNVDLNGRKAKVPEAIEDCLTKPLDGCNISITHLLPTFFDYNGRFDKNIGLFAYETDTLTPTWVRACNRMDEVWVINNDMVAVCLDSGVNIPIKVLPHACDINKYFQKYETESQQLKTALSSETFKFYAVGEFIQRKNYEGLLRAFWSEFRPGEPVDLVIKTSRDGASPEECRRKFIELCEQVKRGLKLFGHNTKPYRNPIIITDYLSENNLCYLHQKCDCYVTASRGEAWCIPAFDAMGFGKTPIVPKSTGFVDYIEHARNGFLIDTRLEPVYLCESFPDLYTSRENWWSPDLLDLRLLMRYVYDRLCLKSVSDQGRQDSEKWNYQSIGQIFKENLSEPKKSLQG